MASMLMTPDPIELAAATLCVQGASPDMMNNKLCTAVSRARDLFQAAFEHSGATSVTTIAGEVRTAAYLAKRSFEFGQFDSAAAQILYIIGIAASYGPDVLAERHEYAIVESAPALWALFSIVLQEGEMGDEEKSAISDILADMNRDPDTCINGFELIGR